MSKKILTMPDNCTVRMDGELFESTDFVAVLAKPTGEASIYYNTDALSLGMAMKMVAKSFVECMNQCTPEEQREIESVLGDAFIEKGDFEIGQD